MHERLPAVRFRSHSAGRRAADPDREPERRADSRRAAHADVPAVQLGEALGDRESQSRAGDLLAVGGGDASEGLEDTGLIRRRNPDAAVAHFEAQHAEFRHYRFVEAHLGVRAADRDPNRPARGEFDRVAHEIEQDLHDADPVAAHTAGHARTHGESQSHALGAGGCREQVDHVLGRARRLEIGFTKLEMVRLDFRQVEDVVDDRQQRVAGAQDRLHLSRQGRRQRGGVELLGGAHDAGDGGAYLVTDRGERARLCGARVLGDPPRALVLGDELLVPELQHDLPPALASHAVASRQRDD